MHTGAYPHPHPIHASQEYLPNLVRGDLEEARVRLFWSWEEEHIWEIERVSRHNNLLAVALVELVDSELLKPEIWAGLWVKLAWEVASSIELCNSVIVGVEKEAFGFFGGDMLIHLAPPIFCESSVDSSLLELDQD